jgi:hypothetical protein
MESASANFNSGGDASRREAPLHDCTRNFRLLVLLALCFSESFVDFDRLRWATPDHYNWKRS